MKNKILITGFSGFVARHYIEYLYKNNIFCSICGMDIKEPNYSIDFFNDKLSIEFKKVDMLNIEEVNEVIRSFSPDYILHLASYSSVAYSWEHPDESFVNNTNIFLNLINAVKLYVPSCRVLSVGSSEEYGLFDEDDLPLTEDHSLNPISPYSVARVSQEMLSKVYASSYGLNIILTRSFNHIGPYQDDRFVVPGFIKRIIAIKESGEEEGTIEVGDISIIRDFVDVRDVVRAYHLLLLNGKIGEVYNICSGEGVSLSEIIEQISNKVGVRINVECNKQYIRPNDIKKIVGSNEKVKKELDWKEYVSLGETIDDMIEDYYRRM